MHTGEFTICIPAGFELGSHGDIPCPCTTFSKGVDASPVFQFAIPDRVISVSSAVESFGNPKDVFVGIDYVAVVCQHTPPYRCHGAVVVLAEFCETLLLFCGDSASGAEEVGGICCEAFAAASLEQ